MSLTIKQLLLDATQKLNDAGVSTAALDASVLMCFVTGKTRVDLYLDENTELPQDQQSEFIALIARREQHEPVAYITGEKEFWGLSFHVTPDVLIPRPDTETLVATLRAYIPDKKVSATFVDVGTGSGAIAISMLTEFENMSAIMVDISAEALAVAKKNTIRHGVDDRAEMMCASLLAGVQTEVDFVVSNPPYITTSEMGTLDPDVKNFEPHLALEAGDQGLDCYRLLVPQAYGKIKTGGLLVLEIGMLQAMDVKEICRQSGFGICNVIQDLAGRDRVVIAQKEKELK